MGQFVDENDARRPAEFPRISERYRTNIETLWFPPAPSLFRSKPKGIKVQVLDLSVAGALLAAPTNTRLVPGMKLKMMFDDVIAVIAVRNIWASSTPGQSYYGIAFFQMAQELEAKVMQLVADIKTSY